MRRSALLLLALLALATPALAIEVQERWLVPKQRAFPALDAPESVRAAKERALRADDPVIGVARSGDACAYPLRLMAKHRIANAQLGGSEILVVYCRDASAGTAWDPRVDGKPLLFDFYGYYDGVTVLNDRATGSLWSALTGECLKGQYRGRRLDPVPSLVTTWAQWREVYPDTSVLPLKDPMEYEQRVRFPSDGISGDARRSRLPHHDRGAPGDELVVGVTVEGQERAYPYRIVRTARGVITDTLGGTPVVVFLDEETGAGAAYQPVSRGRAFTFASEKQYGHTVFIDRETSSVWEVDGRCHEGLLKGRSLAPVRYLQAKWYAWAAYHPRTEVYSEKPAPRERDGSE